MIKKTLKYFLAGITALLIIIILVILAFSIRYKINTGKETGVLVVTAKPGETGRWVNPFIGTGGFPPYTSADDAVSKLAAELGRKEDAKLFLEHSQYYRNVWNPETQYFQPKKSAGEFVTEFKPLKLTYLDFKSKYTEAYVEGSALQWRRAPFFDADGLTGLFKNKEFFVNELNDFFAKSNPARGTLNGTILDRRWFRHSEVAQGGILKFEMTNEPVI